MRGPYKDPFVNGQVACVIRVSVPFRQRPGCTPGTGGGIERRGVDGHRSSSRTGSRVRRSIGPPGPAAHEREGMHGLKRAFASTSALAASSSSGCLARGMRRGRRRTRSSRIPGARSTPRGTRGRDRRRIRSRGWPNEPNLVHVCAPQLPRQRVGARASKPGVYVCALALWPSAGTSAILPRGAQTPR